MEGITEKRFASKHTKDVQFLYMEGEKGSEPELPRPPSTEPENTAAAASGGRSWRNRLKIPLPTRVAAALLAIGGGAAATVVGITEMTQSGPSQGEPAATTHIDKPPSATDQVVEITPKVTVSPTPSPEATPTATASPPPEATTKPTPPSTETPTPTENKPSGNWEIAPRSPDSHVTVEDWNKTKLLVESVFEKFPHIGNLQVYIVEGVGSAAPQFSQDPQKPSVIFVGAQGSITNVQNELSGYFRKKLNGPTLSANYKPETLARMLELDPQITAPYADYSPENIFGEKMLAASPFSRVAQTAYIFYVGQAIPLPSESGKINYPLEKPLFADLLASPLYLQFSQETEGEMNNSHDFEEFAQDQHDRLEQLKASSPLHKLAIEWLQANAALLKNANVLSGPGLQLDDKDLSVYFEKILIVWENYALTRLFDQKDPGLLAMFTDQQIQDLAANYQKIIDAVENEIFIRALNMQIQGVIDDPAAAEYYKLIWENW
ncbi:hypothetical protein A3I56_01305 [Candidatus Roizmanbacteria bacterium RIFCSPLOWO2_02_FULL_43_10]|uniref:Uncharacterized protein n=1 Tax=Candidatus Roizmanbacteria bacterium RIFCSPLOWO2_02_FULL_43_10 TaxID=1802078 RepID=A0A1F7JTL2_9BACT|nr:MAG: hypothetical protein A3I56_01305 [Candidatus Roizmanbacteria bacterium RIFCSPLOWO2_02_FULL_43_10]